MNKLNESILLDLKDICEIENKDQDLTFNNFLLYGCLKGININKETFEQDFNFKNKDNKYNLMSYLFADKNDISIKVNTFKDNDKSVLIKRNEYGNKCLFLAIESVLNYVERLNDTNIDLSQLSKINLKLFDFNCIKEAWINACVHNQWDEKYSPQVSIFKDYIQIESNGGIPKNLSKKDFFEGVKKPVNPKLNKIFKYFNLSDETNKGISTIVKKYGKKVFEIDENSIWLKIPFNNKTNNNQINNIKSHLNDNQIKVIKEILKKPDITIHQLSSALSLSEGYIKKIINQLKNKNLIERNGSRKNGNWTIISYNL